MYSRRGTTSPAISSTQQPPFTLPSPFSYPKDAILDNKKERNLTKSISYPLRSTLPPQRIVAHLRPGYCIIPTRCHCGLEYVVVDLPVSTRNYSSSYIIKLVRSGICCAGRVVLRRRRGSVLVFMFGDEGDRWLSVKRRAGNG